MTKSHSSLRMAIKLAMNAGATDEEIADALFLADHADRWGAIYHMLHYNQFTLEDKVSDRFPRNRRQEHKEEEEARKTRKKRR